MPDPDVVADLAAAEGFLNRGTHGLDVIRALARRGSRDFAARILAVQKMRVSGDYLQTPAVVLPGQSVLNATMIRTTTKVLAPAKSLFLTPSRVA
jgi:propanediol dehydratase large subunit